MSDFGDRLKEAMEKEKLTASELAKITGIGKNLISYYINGKCIGKQDKIYMLAKALHVDPGWLITGVQPRKSQGETDDSRLEALHQNPKLCLLFDRTSRMKPDDVDFMLQMADRITKENYGE